MAQILILCAEQSDTERSTGDLDVGYALPVLGHSADGTAGQVLETKMYAQGIH